MSLCPSRRDDPQLRPRLPAAAGEVWEPCRPAAVSQRPIGERRDDRECHGVVDIHVGGHAFAEALDEPVVLEVIHAAVPGASALFLYLLPQWMVELGPVGLRRIPLVRLAPPLDIDAIGLPLKQTARALDDGA